MSLTSALFHLKVGQWIFLAWDQTCKALVAAGPDGTMASTAGGQLEVSFLEMFGGTTRWFGGGFGWLEAFLSFGRRTQGLEKCKHPLKFLQHLLVFAFAADCSEHWIVSAYCSNRPTLSSAQSSQRQRQKPRGISRDVGPSPRYQLPTLVLCFFRRSRLPHFTRNCAGSCWCRCWILAGLAFGRAVTAEV